MTAGNVSVILVGLILGYVIVSWWLSRRQAGTGPSPRAQPRPDGTESTGEQLPWHEILQVPANASLDEIRLAYRRRIAEYHPDKTGGLGEDLRALAEEKSKLINAAYEEAQRAFGRW